MKRRIYENLLQWKASGTEKPLMVIGARQIGKTYAIEAFCRKEFDRAVILDLAKRPEIAAVFEQNIAAEEKVARLELLIGEKICEAGTVVFFDEVQESEELIAAMKYFAESDLPCRVVCAGSLLGVKLKRFHASFPVGKVWMLDMFPMDFEEFLWAMGEEALAAEIRSCFDANRGMQSPLHEKCLKLFRTYLCSGGMPEAVLDMAENGGDVLLFKRSILTNIFHAYLYDMNKYVASVMESARIEAIYQSIPAQIGNQSRKFQYAKVKQSARARDYEAAMQWLVSSRMVYPCTAVSRPETPLAGFQDPEVFKLFLNDTGLLCSLLGIPLSVVMLDEDYAYKGAIVENYVATQLAARGIPLFYWRVESKYEIDFLLDMDEGIVPVETKSGKNKRSASMEAFRKRYEPGRLIRITANDFGETDGIRSIPLYAAFCLQPRG